MTDTSWATELDKLCDEIDDLLDQIEQQNYTPIEQNDDKITEITTKFDEITEKIPFEAINETKTCKKSFITIIGLIDSLSVLSDKERKNQFYIITEKTMELRTKIQNLIELFIK